MMYNQTVTIINLVNEKGRTTAFFHILPNVHYQDKQTVRTGSQDMFSDNQGYVAIPHSLKGYLSPLEYSQLPDKTNHWTIQENDYIVKGEQATVPFVEIQDLQNVRLINSFENIDYNIVIEGHYGVTLK